MKTISSPEERRVTEMSPSHQRAKSSTRWRILLARDFTAPGVRPSVTASRATSPATSRPSPHRASASRMASRSAWLHPAGRCPGDRGVSLVASVEETRGVLRELRVSGDRWFTLAARQGKDGSNTEGQSEMLGGEGKYAGITGLCTYAVTALPDRWQTTTITCDWIRE